MKKFSYLITVIGLGLCLSAQSQAIYSLTEINKMVLDPAFTGMDTAYRHVASVYDKSYIPNSAPDYKMDNLIGLYQMNLDKIHSGAGIMINYNYASFNNSDIQNQIATKLYYRYKLFPGLSVGLDAGFVNLKSDYTFEQIGYGPLYTYTTQSELAKINSFDFDAGAGMLYKYKSSYAGFAIDHITKPQTSFPYYSEFPYYQNSTVQVPMPNYTGVAYNWIIGTYIGGSGGGIDLTAAYRSQVLNLNATFQLHHFFFGASAMFANYYNDNIPEMFSNETYNFWAFMAGIKAYHNKIKATLAYDYYTPVISHGTAPIYLESGLSYSF